MSEVLYIDFETRSAVDLKKSGADVYARDASTDLLCLGFAFDDAEPALWTPDDLFLDRDVEHHIASGGLVVGHNVGGFEVPIWNHVGPRYGFPPLKIGQCRDTMAMAHAMALPGALADAAPALGLTVNKDSQGQPCDDAALPAARYRSAHLVDSEGSP